MVIYSGGTTYILYQREATYGTDPGWNTAASHKHFGQGVKITGIKRSNNAKPVWGLGNRATQGVAIGTWGGSMDIEFAVTNHLEFLSALYADTDSPYGATVSQVGNGSSLAIFVGTDYSGASWQQITLFNGCVITNAKFSLETGENPVMCTLSILYKSETTPATKVKGSTSGQYAQPTNDYDTAAIFSFGQVTNRSLNGVTTYIIERGEISMSSNSKMVYGLGNRLPQGKADAPIEYTGNFRCIIENEVLLQQSYDGNTTATGPQNDFSPMTSCTFTLGNGTTDVVFTFYSAGLTTTPGAYVTEYNQTAEIGEPLAADVGVMGTNITITSA